MKLYGYCRSSAAFRVRIALNLKGIAYESRPINLVELGKDTVESRVVRMSIDEILQVIVACLRRICLQMRIRHREQGCDDGLVRCALRPFHERIEQRDSFLCMAVQQLHAGAE